MSNGLARSAGPPSPSPAGNGPPVLRAAGYRRVSMREQVDGHSLDAQATHIQNYITAQGWRLVELYTDAGLSAKKGSARPAFDRMLAAARSGEMDVIVVDKIDRFSRHLGTLLVSLEQLNVANVAFVSVQEHLDLTTPWGKLMLTVLGMLAEIYIDNLRQETRKGKVQRARDGLWNGTIPFGYCAGRCSHCTDPNGPGYCPNVGQPDKTDGKHVIAHPIESHAVKLAFEWYVADTISDGQVAQRLNAYTHVLPDGSSVHFRTKGMPGRYAPGPISKDMVRELLQRQFYTGQVAYRGIDEHGQRRRRLNVAETFQGQQPVLVEPALFNKAQEIRQVLWRSPRAKNGHAAAIYPLSGLIRCATCYRPMRAISTSGRRYYQDTTRLEHCGECQQCTVRADDIEQQVAEWISKIELPPNWPQGAAEWLDMHNAENGRLAQRRWERAKEMYLKGDLGHEQYEVERKAYESNNWVLTNSMFSAILALGDLVRDFAQEWAKALPIEKRKLLRLVLAAVLVLPQLTCDNSRIPLPVQHTA